MTGAELARELGEIADRIERLRAEVFERTASGDLAPALPELVPSACRMAGHAGALARELYAREAEAHGAPWVAPWGAR